LKKFLSIIKGQIFDTENHHNFKCCVQKWKLFVVISDKELQVYMEACHNIASKYAN